jgi:PPOX class probable F420-dependent enzyme
MAVAAKEAPHKAGRREWIGLTVIALPCVLYSMDLTVLHLAVPQLSAQLQPSSAELVWIIDIFGFLVAGSLVTMGTLGDGIGRRRLVLVGAAAFGVASVIAAFSSSAEMLIATRALLGVAGATLAPSTMSLIRNMFHDSRQFTTAIGVSACESAATPLAPRSGQCSAAWCSNPSGGARLSLVAVLAMIFGLKLIAQDGLDWLPVLSILVGVALGYFFVRRQFGLADPLIDVRLFKLRAFTGSLALYGLGVFVLFGGFLFGPQYLQLVLPPDVIPGGTPAMLDFARTWQAADKSVYSKSLRRHGAGVATPVNLAIEGDHGYFRTYSRAAKLKRIRRNPNGQVAAASRLGKLSGPTFPCRIRVLDGIEAAHAEHTIKRKHPIVQGVLVSLAHTLMRESSASTWN